MSERATRVAALARKELVQLRRDPLSLGLLIALPTVLLLVFGHALTLAVDRVPLAVLDRDGCS